MESYVFQKEDNLVRAIKRSASLNTGVTFIESSDREVFLSYHDLFTLASQRLFHLQNSGMQPGHELVLQLDDNQDFLITFWACLLGGMIPVPLSFGRNTDQLEKVIKVWDYLSTPRLISTEAQIQKLLDYDESSHTNIAEHYLTIESCGPTTQVGEIYEPTGDDVAFIQFSSGSTGVPKGVRLTHHNLIANIVGISKAAEYDSTDSLLSWMPLTHDMGMIGFHLNPLFCGINSYLIPTQTFVRKPTLWVEKAAEYRATVLCSPNFGYRYLLKYIEGKLDSYDWDLSAVRIIYNGAEPISEALCQEFLNDFARYGLKRSAMCPVYGLAEASVAVSMSDLQAEVRYVDLVRNQLSPGRVIEFGKENEDTIKFVNVGTAVEGCELRITHDDQRVGEGIIGNIEIKGSNVTTGYHNNTEATNKALGTDGWLITGDLGFIDQGCLFVTGRAKDILFVNGQNFYAHDIENEAQNISGVELNKIVVAGYADQSTGTERILAFILFRGKIEKFVSLATELNELISSTYGFSFDLVLPVKNIPKTTSGKLQRFKLLSQYLEGDFDKAEQALITYYEKHPQVPLVEPTNEQEAQILTLWKKVLGSEEIGIDHKFFEVGGNSLKATMLIAKLEATLQVKLSANQLRGSQSVRTLSAAISELPKQLQEPLPSYSIKPSYPLSPAQKRMFLAWELDKDSIAYNLPVVFELDGNVQIDRIANSINELIARHDLLRSTFTSGDSPTWAVRDTMSVHLERIEGGELESVLHQLIRPFDLINGPLVRAAIIQTANSREQYLFLDFHHIISDGHSVHNFIGELLDVYDTRPLEPMSTTYGNYTLWQHEISSEEKRQSMSYWSGQLKDLQLLDLPTDYPRPNVLSFEGRRILRVLDEKASDQLRKLANSRDVSVHAMLMTAYQILVFKYARQRKLSIGIPVHGRIHPELHPIQGMFVNNLPIVSELDHQMPISAAIDQTHRYIQEALENQSLSFDEMVALQEKVTLPGRSPLFDTMFLFQNDEITGKRTRDFEISRYDFDPGFSKFDLSLDVIDNSRTISCAFEYATDLFAEDTVVSMADSFEKIIHKFLTDPEATIEAIPLTAGYEKGLDNHVPFESVVSRFLSQASKNPDAIALTSEGAEWSYEALYDQTLKAAHYLEKAGVNAGDIVLVHLPRSCEFIITLLGLFYKRAAFIPIDVTLPVQHKQNILEDSGCSLFIHAKSAPLEISTVNCTGIWVEELMQETQPILAPEEVSKDDLAYLIYTSGTTGKPKGVTIGHESLSNYISFVDQVYIDEDVTTFSLYSSVSFDLTITSIFAPLISGNRLVIYEERDENEVLIQTVFEDDQVDIVKLTPSHLRLLRDNNLISADTRIRKYILGGEALQYQLANDLSNLVEGAKIWNEYGPTEATVGCMIHLFDLNDQGEQVSIGKAIPNVRIYLLDDRMTPVPPGMVGEIFVSGVALAKGYLNRAELTADKFVDDPFVPGAKMYRTGDHAKQKPDGNLEYIGRIDSQVKINGHRVELAHIEQVMMQHELVTDVSAILSADGTSILAFYSVEGEQVSVDEVHWRQLLSTQLPHYMMPSQLYGISTMPLTRNGKVDTQSLLDSIPVKEKTSAANESVSEPQELLLRAWKDILGVDEVDVDDNFYQLGGDSIKAVQIATRLYEKGYSVKTKDILIHHTIRQISHTVELLNEAHRPDSGLQEGRFDLSPIQQWFFDQHLANPDFYHQSVTLKLKQEVTPAWLQGAFNRLIQYHDVLRLNYDVENHQMYYNNELINQSFSIDVHEVDQDEEVVSICQQLKNSTRIAEGFLLGAALIKVRKSKATLLFITAHHLIMDGISWRVLLADLYQDYGSGEAYSLENRQKTASYKSYVNYLRQASVMEQYSAEQAYWSEMVSQPVSIPQDEPVGLGKVSDLGTVSTVIDEATTAYLLKEAHEIYNTDMPILLNTVLLLALEEWTEMKTFLIEQESHGRNHEGIDLGGTVGWFTSIYPVRFDYQKDLSALIKAVKETLKTVPNDGMGYGINKFLAEQTEISDQTQFRFNYLGQFGEELNNDLFQYLPDFDHGPDSASENSPTAMLELNCMVVEDQLRIYVNYPGKAYRVSKMKFLLDLFEKHLAEVIAHVKDQEEVDYTPSDFTYSSLDSEELDALFS